MARLSGFLLRLIGILALVAVIYIGASTIIVRVKLMHQRQQLIRDVERSIAEYEAKRERLRRQLAPISTVQGRIDLMHDMGWVIPGEKIVYVDIPDHVVKADQLNP